MKLSVLTQHLPYLDRSHFTDNEITGVVSDSSAVQKGNLFVAVVGTKTDGHLFVEDAIKRGAVSLVIEKDIAVATHIPTWKVKNTRQALSHLAACWNDHPSKKIPIIGITGTNGKTTTSYLLEGILRDAKKNPGLIGTTGYRYNERLRALNHTTPESTEIQRILAEMLDGGVRTAILEVSSHAIDMHRVRDIVFDLAIFSNLSPEHLDYHITMEEYFESKKKLFTELLPHGKGLKKAIINADDPYGLALIDFLKDGTYLTYSTKAQSKWDVYVQAFDSTLNGMCGTLATPAGIAKFRSKLIGKFNLSNILAAISAALTCGIPLENICQSIENFQGVPGRLERIANSRGIHIFVDYAHTPDALKNVLTSIRELNPGRMITVFGCGGDRDRGKRPIMGREVACLSDVAVVTSDNPRTEDPGQIIQAILPGVIEGGRVLDQDAFVIIDRKEAIIQALRMAKEGDVLLVAGKGHEDYQIIGSKKIHFDDREVIREALD